MRDVRIVAGVLCAVASLAISIWDVYEGRKRNGKDQK